MEKITWLNCCRRGFGLPVSDMSYWDHSKCVGDKKTSVIGGLNTGQEPVRQGLGSAGPAVGQRDGLDGFLRFLPAW